jgi:hypothetical protein
MFFPFALILLLVTQADAQQTTADSFLAFRVGQDTRASMAGARVEGRVVGMGADSILLETDTGRRFLPLRTVDSVWTRTTSVKRSALKAGLISGAVVGTLTLAVCLAASGDASSDCGNGGADTFLFPVVYFGIGAVPGAAVGGLVGSVPRWHLRFSR